MRRHLVATRICFFFSCFFFRSSLVKVIYVCSVIETRCMPLTRRDNGSSLRSVNYSNNKKDSLWPSHEDLEKRLIFRYSSVCTYCFSCQIPNDVRQLPQFTTRFSVS